MSLRAARPLLVWVHRWVGLTVGIIFAVVSLSGGVLIFQEHFWAWAHGGLTPPGMPSEIGSIDRWIANGKAAVPDLGEPVAVWPPHVEHNLSDAGMLIFGGRPPGGLGNMGFVAVLVAPATGEVLGIVDVDRSPAYAPLFLHRDLWSGQTGRLVSGIAAVGTTILLIVGLYLWWPSRRQLTRKLSGRPWRTTLTRARPLHDWAGVWTLPLLAVLTVTGLYLVQPTWVQPALDVAAGPEPPEAAPADVACPGPMTFDTAIAQALSLVPSSRFKSLYPAGDGTRWEIALAAGGEARHDEAHVLADLKCGSVAVEATPATRAGGESAALWISDVHDGAAFGAAGPAMMLLGGIAPVLLAWSGISMWLRRREGARERRARAARPRAAAATASSASSPSSSLASSPLASQGSEQVAAPWRAPSRPAHPAARTLHESSR